MTDGEERLNKRVEALEVLTAFQERTISKLDATVLAFTQRVEKVERELQRLRAENSASQVGPQDDPPPHY